MRRFPWPAWPTAGVGAREYVSPARRPLTPEEQLVRDVAWGLKRGDSAAVRVAAREMAPLVPAGAVLVPIPNHHGDIGANLALCAEIAALTGSRVVPALRRRRPVESSRLRRRAGMPSVPPWEQEIDRVPGVSLGDDPVVFIDNVMATGATFAAARLALGRGTGLAYAADPIAGATVAQRPPPCGEVN